MNCNQINRSRMLSANKKSAHFSVPPLNAQAVRSFIIRYEVQSALANNLTHGNLMSFLGVFATSTTSTAYLAYSYKLTRVRLWGPVGTGSSVTKLKVDWATSTNNVYAPSSTYTAQSMGGAELAYLDCKPPRNSASAMWHTASTDVALYLEASVGSIVEFHFSFVLNDDNAGLSGPTVTGASLGTLYHWSLSTVLVPVSLNAIA